MFEWCLTIFIICLTYDEGTMTLKKLLHTIYQVKYIAVKDSIYYQGLALGSMKTESDHLERMNNAKPTLQNEVIELKEEMLSRQKYLTSSLGRSQLQSARFSLILYRSYC